ncbi:hypothetical protein [Natronococcus roseus]|uniref:hypothetical protein n=1 Tax=Natronococcus roseus TaxID=1052014 RepID=UPI00374DC301
MFVTAFGLIELVLFYAEFDRVLETVGGDETAAEPKTNCPNCGARMAVDADRCEYCDRSPTDGAAAADADRNRADDLADDETPDYGWVDE